MKMKIKDSVPTHDLENFSNRFGSIPKGIKVLKKCNYWVDVTHTVSGDAPKVLLHIYDYSKDNTYRKSHRNQWPLYIAKTGHKWYPNESITEYLLNQLGSVFGLNMAKSDLIEINGQLRFLSKYFLDPKTEELVHGAEIFAGYLSDPTFVEAVEEANLSRDFFTLQFVEKAVRQRFPNDYQNILKDLVRLLLFDALVGNNDRHFYNWAVIRPMSTKGSSHFSPVYDTARGLFWNYSDSNLEKWKHPKQMSSYIEKYCKGSRPKLGWVKESDINHFKLVRYIYESEFYMSKDEISSLFCDSILTKMLQVIESDVSSFYTPLRKKFIINCLTYRFNTIKEIIA